MNLREGGYRAACGLLGIGAFAETAGMARWTGGRLLYSGPLIFYTVAHALLFAVAFLRALRPARSGSPAGLLLTVSLVLVVFSGAAIRFGPDWLPTARLGMVALGYIAIRLCAPRAPGPPPGPPEE